MIVYAVRSVPSLLSLLCFCLFHSLPLFTGQGCEDRRSVLNAVWAPRTLPGELGAGGLQTRVAAASPRSTPRKLVRDCLPGRLGWVCGLQTSIFIALCSAVRMSTN